MLTKTAMAFAIILNPAQAINAVSILSTKTTMAFAITALMSGRRQEIIAEMGRATSTDMARVTARDAAIVADANILVGNRG